MNQAQAFPGTTPAGFPNHGPHCRWLAALANLGEAPYPISRPGGPYPTIGEVVCGFDILFVTPRLVTHAKPDDLHLTEGS